MKVQEYITILNLRYKSGISREHSYRGDLQNLLESILTDVLVTNEPARTFCGAPDYLLSRKGIPIGHIEAKDIGTDLTNKSLKEQFDRYRLGLDNLIFTDYLDFHFYKDGVFTTSIGIGRIEGKTIVGIPENFAAFVSLIENFALTISRTIKSPTKLAEMMAGKAKLMSSMIKKSLDNDDGENVTSSLKEQMLTFKRMLIHDINNAAFADIYAQTIAYGMFAARYHDPTLPTFSRQEAATLIPKSNPFLRKLFQEIAGYDLDERLIWIVDELVNVFLATDVADIMQNFGKNTKQEDPVIHFYETFLAAYNPGLRKARGVWYTPQPVVNFIVRAVDEILKSQFDLPKGLADTNTIKIKTKHVTKATSDLRSKLKEVELEREVHRVQILDPATGTGTFLTEVVRHIYKQFEGQQGIWNSYVAKHLIPRLNGFELLMASYAMAHLKLDMLLSETGYKPSNDQRFQIYLTNSLEESHPDSGTLFSSWLSDEANQANALKSESPVMVVMGNPPYSVSSTNKSNWIENLLNEYKLNLNERNIQPLSDDYIKFIRFGQYYINKNGEGVLAYISNNSFLNGLIHRQMRKSLIETFDDIYVLNLHGNGRLKEHAPDGSSDKNVFDIMAGVSINIFVKRKGTNTPKNFNYHGLLGSREFKYSFLNGQSLSSIVWNRLDVKEPEYLFVPKNFALKSSYDKGFFVNELILLNNSGLTTEFDELAILDDKLTAESMLRDLQLLSCEQIMIKHSFTERQLEKISNAKRDVERNCAEILPISYRPFDIKYCIYTGQSNGIMGRPRNSIMKHFIVGNNVGLIVKRGFDQANSSPCFVTDKIFDRRGWTRPGMQGAESIFPIYRYSAAEKNQLSMEDFKSKTPNLDIRIVSQIEESLNLKYEEDGKSDHENTFGPLDLLDYIYAVLHSKNYCREYTEFLKIDFPRVPYPTNSERFFTLVSLGRRLRNLHLLETQEVEVFHTQFPESGDGKVNKPIFTLSNDGVSGSVFINEVQYFSRVPKIAWEFYIGGYQPAQKWLKDRVGRKLDYHDTLHYQRIIAALARTNEIMIEIDKVLEI